MIITLDDARTDTLPAPATGLLTASRLQLACKRTIDVIASVTLLLLLAPIMLVIAAAVVLTSRGGAVFIQDRCGQHGRPFRLWKFRSMYADAEQRLNDLADLNECEGPVFKLRRDPRVTPLGRLLRSWSLDELPQLVNVLVGHMSLVGPRPALPAEVARYTPHDLGRLAAKPGITCIWQVSGRSDLDFTTWVDMDLDYIRNWSLPLDLKLLLQTVPAVLSRRGAY